MDDEIDSVVAAQLLPDKINAAKMSLTDAQLDLIAFTAANAPQSDLDIITKRVEVRKAVLARLKQMQEDMKKAVNK